MRPRTMLAFAAGPVLAGLLSLAVIPLMAYELPPADVGYYYLLQTIAALASAALTLGLDQAYVREYHESSRPAVTWLSAMWLPMMLVLVVAAVSAFLPEVIAGALLGVPSTPYGWTVIACLVLGVLVRFLQVRLRMEQHAVAFSIGNLLPKICVAAILVANIAVGTSTSTYLTVASAHLVGLTLACLLALAAGATRATGVSPRQLRDETGPLLRYGYPLAIAALVNWSLLSAPVWFVRALAPSNELALLSITLGIAGLATLVQVVFGTIWAPVAYGWLAGDEVALPRIRQVGRLVAVGIMLVLCCAALLGMPVARALPATYAESGTLLAAAVLPGLLVTLAEVSGIGVQVSRRNWWALGATIGAAVFSGATCALVVQEWGARGAAVALGGSFVALLWMRTAAAAWLWHSTVPSRHMLTVTLLSILAILQAALGDAGSAGWWAGVWTTSMLSVLFLFRRDLAAARHTISEWRSPST